MWVSGLVRRRGARLAGTALGVALAVTILASLGAFFAASKERMTQQAVAGVPVDWQVQLTPGTDPTRAGHIVASAPGVTATVPVGYADTTGFKATVGGSQQTTGPGKVLGMPSNYAQTFPGEIRFLVGARTGALLAQQTAANLHAAIGTMVSVGRPGLAPAQVRRGQTSQARRSEPPIARSAPGPPPSSERRSRCRARSRSCPRHREHRR